MTIVDLECLANSLDKLLEESPCHNKGCIGYMSCDVGIHGAYGNVCAIEEVQDYVSSLIYKKKKEE